MVRPTDWERTTVGRVACYPQVSRGRAVPDQGVGGTQGDTRLVRRQRNERNLGKNVYWGFCGKGWVRQGGRA